MSDQEAPPRFAEADAIAPAVPVADGAGAPPVGTAPDAAGTRPELLIAATFVGGLLTARILKRLASR